MNTRRKRSSSFRSLPLPRPSFFDLPFLGTEFFLLRNFDGLTFFFLSLLSYSPGIAHPTFMSCSCVLHAPRRSLRSIERHHSNPVIGQLASSSESIQSGPNWEEAWCDGFRESAARDRCWTRLGRHHHDVDVCERFAYRGVHCVWGPASPSSPPSSDGRRSRYSGTQSVPSARCTTYPGSRWWVEFGRVVGG